MQFLIQEFPISPRETLVFFYIRCYKRNLYSFIFAITRETSIRLYSLLREKLLHVLSLQFIEICCSYFCLKLFLMLIESFSSQELAYHGDEGHNWWSIIFSLLVIGLIIVGIVTAIYLLGYVDELLYWHGKRLQLNDFMQVRTMNF